MDSVRPDVLAFFEHYGRAGDDPDPSNVANCFCEVFMSLDPNSAAAVSPQALLAALPARKQLFASIGSDGLELSDLTETPLDDLHTLVRTSWRVRKANDSAQGHPITLRSTFLLRKEGGAWRIAVYLNHQDIGRLFAELAAQA
jgi:hypothetical protein